MLELGMRTGNRLSATQSVKGPPTSFRPLFSSFSADPKVQTMMMHRHHMMAVDVVQEHTTAAVGLGREAKTVEEKRLAAPGKGYDSEEGMHWAQRV